eukprot:3599987-Amphidinium_carterae.1
MGNATEEEHIATLELDQHTSNLARLTLDVASQTILTGNRVLGYRTATKPTNAKWDTMMR